MSRLFILSILALPFLELWVLVSVAVQIGVLNTIALVILTSMIGSIILKRQGLAILRNADWRMQRGEMPITEISDGLWLAIGAVLLIIPGFITDVIGALCLLPFFRKLITRFLLPKMYVQNYVYTQTSYHESHKPTGERTGITVDGEVIK
jgi:UPF0716 protein FxsA